MWKPCSMRKSPTVGGVTNDAVRWDCRKERLWALVHSKVSRRAAEPSRWALTFRGRLRAVIMLLYLPAPVAYTHMTLPKKREV